MDRENNLKPMTFGEILDYTFSIYRKNFLRLIVAFGILTLPIGVISSIIDSNVGPSINKYLEIIQNNPNDSKAIFEAIQKLESHTSGSRGLMLIIGIVSLIASCIYLPAVYKMLSEAFNDRVMTVESAYKHAAKRFLSYLGAVLLSFIIGIFIIVVAAIAICIVFGILYLIAMYAGALKMLLIIIFSLALIFVFIMVTFYLVGAFSFMAVASAIEEKSPLEAIKRGFKLAGFKLFRFIGANILIYLIILIPSIIITQIGVGISNSSGIPIIQHIISVGTDIVFKPIWFVLIIVLYYDYKIRREAIDIEQSYSELQ